MGRLGVFHNDGEVSLFILLGETGGKSIGCEVLVDLHHKSIVLVEPEDLGNHRQLLSFTVAAGQQDIISTESSDQLPDACETRQEVQTFSTPS